VLLHRITDVRGQLVDNVDQDRLGFFPVALEGDHDGDFVPDEGETLVHVGQHFGEDFAVGNVNDAPGALLGVDATADFQHAKRKETNVDDIPHLVGNFNAVAHDKRPSPHNKNPARQGHNQILQGNG